MPNLCLKIFLLFDLPYVTEIGPIFSPEIEFANTSFHLVIDVIDLGSGVLAVSNKHAEYLMSPRVYFNEAGHGGPKLFFPFTRGPGVIIKAKEGCRHRQKGVASSNEPITI